MGFAENKEFNFVSLLFATVVDVVDDNNNNDEIVPN